MLANRLHVAEPELAAAFATVGRVARAILCLAGVTFLVVALRYGIYEHFHGDGRLLADVLDAIGR